MPKWRFHKYLNAKNEFVPNKYTCMTVPYPKTSLGSKKGIMNCDDQGRISITDENAKLLVRGIEVPELEKKILELIENNKELFSALKDAVLTLKNIGYDEDLRDNIELIRWYARNRYTASKHIVEENQEPEYITCEDCESWLSNTEGCEWSAGFVDLTDKQPCPDFKKKEV